MEVWNQFEPNQGPGGSTLDPLKPPPYAREAEKEDNSKFIWVRHVSDSDSEEIFTRVRSLPENFEELEEAFNAREAEKENN